MSCGLDRLSVLSAKLEGKGIDRLGQRDRPVLVTHMIAKRHFLNQVIEGSALEGSEIECFDAASISSKHQAQALKLVKRGVNEEHISRS